MNVRLQLREALSVSAGRSIDANLSSFGIGLAGLTSDSVAEEQPQCVMPQCKFKAIDQAF